MNTTSSNIPHPLTPRTRPGAQNAGNKAEARTLETTKQLLAGTSPSEIGELKNAAKTASQNIKDTANQHIKGAAKDVADMLKGHSEKPMSKTELLDQLLGKKNEPATKESEDPVERKTHRKTVDAFISALTDENLGQGTIDDLKLVLNSRLSKYEKPSYILLKLNEFVNKKQPKPTNKPPPSFTTNTSGPDSSNRKSTNTPPSTYLNNFMRTQPKTSQTAEVEMNALPKKTKAPAPKEPSVAYESHETLQGSHPSSEDLEAMALADPSFDGDDFGGDTDVESLGGQTPTPKNVVDMATANTDFFDVDDDFDDDDEGDLLGGSPAGASAVSDSEGILLGDSEPDASSVSTFGENDIFFPEEDPSAAAPLTEQEQQQKVGDLLKTQSAQAAETLGINLDADGGVLLGDSDPDSVSSEEVNDFEHPPGDTWTDVGETWQDVGGEVGLSEPIDEFEGMSLFDLANLDIGEPHADGLGQQEDDFDTGEAYTPSLADLAYGNPDKESTGESTGESNAPPRPKVNLTQMGLQAEALGEMLDNNIFSAEPPEKETSQPLPPRSRKLGDQAAGEFDGLSKLAKEAQFNPQITPSNIDLNEIDAEMDRVQSELNAKHTAPVPKPTINADRTKLIGRPTLAHKLAVKEGFNKVIQQSKDLRVALHQGSPHDVKTPLKGSTDYLRPTSKKKVADGLNAVKTLQDKLEASNTLSPEENADLNEAIQFFKKANDHAHLGLLATKGVHVRQEAMTITTKMGDNLAKTPSRTNTKEGLDDELKHLAKQARHLNQRADVIRQEFDALEVSIGAEEINRSRFQFNEAEPTINTLNRMSTSIETQLSASNELLQAEEKMAAYTGETVSGFITETQRNITNAKTAKDVLSILSTFNNIMSQADDMMSDLENIPQQSNAKLQARKDKLTTDLSKSLVLLTESNRDIQGLAAQTIDALNTESARLPLGNYQGFASIANTYTETQTPVLDTLKEGVSDSIQAFGNQLSDSIHAENQLSDNNLKALQSQLQGLQAHPDFQQALGEDDPTTQEINTQIGKLLPQITTQLQVISTINEFQEFVEAFKAPDQATNIIIPTPDPTTALSQNKMSLHATVAQAKSTDALNDIELKLVTFEARMDITGSDGNTAWTEINQILQDTKATIGVKREEFNAGANSKEATGLGAPGGASTPDSRPRRKTGPPGGSPIAPNTVSGRAKTPPEELATFKANQTPLVLNRRVRIQDLPHRSIFLTPEESQPADNPNDITITPGIKWSVPANPAQSETPLQQPSLMSDMPVRRARRREADPLPSSPGLPMGEPSKPNTTTPPMPPASVTSQPAPTLESPDANSPDQRNISDSPHQSGVSTEAPSLVNTGRSTTANTPMDPIAGRENEALLNLNDGFVPNEDAIKPPTAEDAPPPPPTAEPTRRARQPAPSPTILGDLTPQDTNFAPPLLPPITPDESGGIAVEDISIAGTAPEADVEIADETPIAPTGLPTIADFSEDENLSIQKTVQELVQTQIADLFYNDPNDQNMMEKALKAIDSSVNWSINKLTLGRELNTNTFHTELAALLESTIQTTITAEESKTEAVQLKLATYTEAKEAASKITDWDLSTEDHATKASDVVLSSTDWAIEYATLSKERLNTVITGLKAEAESLKEHLGQSGGNSQIQKRLDSIQNQLSNYSAPGGELDKQDQLLTASQEAKNAVQGKSKTVTKQFVLQQLTKGTNAKFFIQADDTQTSFSTVSHSLLHEANAKFIHTLVDGNAVTVDRSAVLTHAIDGITQESPNDLSYNDFLQSLFTQITHTNDRAEIEPELDVEEDEENPVDGGKLPLPARSDGSPVTVAAEAVL